MSGICSLLYSVPKIYREIRKNKPNTFVACIETVKFISNFAFVSMEQYFQQNCIPLKGHYDYMVVQFTIKGKLYKIIIRPERGPVDLNMFQLDDEIQAYIRGYRTVVEPTVGLLGMSHLNFQTASGKILQLEEHDSLTSINYS